jgi:hypothetical protein
MYKSRDGRRHSIRVASILVAIATTFLSVALIADSAAAAAPQVARHGLPHAASALNMPGVKPYDTIAACGGANYPPLTWTNDANRYWYGGATGYIHDLVNIGDFMYALNHAYLYMDLIVNYAPDQNYLGAIACRESTFNLGAQNGQYHGMYQLSQADWNGILPNCSPAAFTSTSGCDGFNEWQSQMIAALYYAQQHWGGNLRNAWYSEVNYGYW